jgi:hypothetical protein
LLLDPCRSQLESIEARGLVASDLFISEEDLKDIASADYDSTIQSLALTFAQNMGQGQAKGDEFDAASIISYVSVLMQHLPLLERLEFYFTTRVISQHRFNRITVKLDNLRQLTLIGFDVHYDGLRSVMFSIVGGLKCITLSRVRIYRDGSTTNPGWAGIFSRIEKSCLLIQDLSNMKQLGYTCRKKYDRWLPEDMRSWRSLCDVVEKRRVKQGLHPHRYLYLAKHVRVVNRLVKKARVSDKTSNVVISAGDPDMMSPKIQEIEEEEEEDTGEETEDEISEEPEQPIERDIGRELIRNIENGKDQHVEGEIGEEPEQEVEEEFSRRVADDIGKEPEQDIGQEKTQLIGEEIEEQISKELGQAIDHETV